MLRGWKAAGIAAVLGLGGAAGAHELTCEKTFNGGGIYTVTSYPDTVQVGYSITNVHPSDTSVATSARDAQLESRGITFAPLMPLSLGLGDSLGAGFPLHVGSYEECLELAALDGTADTVLSSGFRVTWDLGETQCNALLICRAPAGGGCDGSSSCQSSTPPPTREAGFFQTHEGALEACVASGPVELGALGQVATAEQALGLLWGSPTLHTDGRVRTEGDSLRFEVGRQLLVATCNERLFGTRPDAALKAYADEALKGAGCAQLQGALEALGDFNGAGVETPRPQGLEVGPASPARAHGRAQDFTRPSGQDCAR